MTCREERIRLMNLSELLASDLHQADDESLVAGLHDAETVTSDGARWAREIIAELKRRYSWSQVVDLTGMKQTTLHNRLYGRAGRRDQGAAAVPEPADRPEHQPVVAAIVTSHLGVLAGQRNDGKPPWTFIAGEVEPGESIADAAVREVKEETGLEVRAAHHEIGRRVHPKTQRTMIYLACSPVAGTDVFVGDPVELAAVRWLTLAQADALLPGMFEPVREHLGRMIS
jgi:8-oxo-dGTP pyrophosphatase MutT (NUDIX family)